MTATPLDPDELRSRIAASPYHRAQNAVLMEVDRGRVTMQITLGPHHLNPQGIVHGGVIAGLLDSVCGLSLRTILPRESAHRTIQLSVSYLAAATEGVLTAEGRAVREGRRIGHAEGEVFGPDGTLVARGTAVFSNVWRDGKERKEESK